MSASGKCLSKMSAPRHPEVSQRFWMLCAKHPLSRLHHLHLHLFSLLPSALTPPCRRQVGIRHTVQIILNSVMFRPYCRIRIGAPLPSNISSPIACINGSSAGFGIHAQFQTYLMTPTLRNVEARSTL